MLRFLNYKILNINQSSFSQSSTPTQLVKHNNRSLLILQGPDSQKLLQGLITNDIKSIKSFTVSNQLIQKIAIYTLFLQQKGKILCDAFIFKPKIYSNNQLKIAQNEFWLDIPTQSRNILKSHLRKHSFKKQIAIHDPQEDNLSQKPTIYSAYNAQSDILPQFLGTNLQIPNSQQGQNQTYSNLIFHDPRGVNFGVRIISSQPQFTIQGKHQIINQQQSKMHKLALGQIPSNIWIGKLPFTYNFDMLNAISLKKGCYMGQQIISRGFLTGIIRKRIFSILLLRQQPVEINSSIKNQQGEQIGKIIFNENLFCLGQINYIPLIQKKVKFPMKISSPEGYLITPFENELIKYYEKMKDKQKILQQLDL